MTGHKFKPGAIGIVSDENGTERVAVSGGMNPRMMHHWHYDEQGIGRIVLPIRPLVVIDPENREQVERLAKALPVDWNLFQDDDPRVGRDTVAGMQAALRSLTAPPKPDEPQGLGAVVEDADGTLWVRHEKVALADMHWHRVGGQPATVAKWAGINAVRELTPGVQS